LGVSPLLGVRAEMHSEDSFDLWFGKVAMNHKRELMNVCIEIIADCKVYRMALSSVPFLLLDSNPFPLNQRQIKHARLQLSRNESAYQRNILLEESPIPLNFPLRYPFNGVYCYTRLTGLNHHS
jgi:hypothetical protein